jgi:D-3-phosphoglycerate dehydrogenase
MSNKPYIVIPDGFDEKIFSELKEENDLEIHSKKKLSREELISLGDKVNGLVVRSATIVDQDLINQLPSLKYVIRAGEGTDNIDKKYCTDRNIRVSNTPGANSNSAAEHAVALMMTLLRKTHHAHSSMSSGKWEKNRFAGNELWKKTVGFVGFGRIGKIVAKRISGFEPNIIFYDPFIETDLEPNYQKFSLEEVFEKSDIITVHTPLNEQTRDLVGKKLISLMKKSGILINAARGGVVNEESLIEALKENKIAAAALDVFEQEPLNENSPLISMQNVVLTPHLGASTAEAQIRVGLMAASQLKEFFINGNLLNEVK